jgi:hypothetical protein
MMSALGQKRTYSDYAAGSATRPVIVVVVELRTRERQSGGFPFRAAGGVMGCVTAMVLTFALIVASTLFGLFVAALILSAIETAQQCAEE